MKPLLYPFVCLALVLGAASAAAASYEDRLIAHLRALGYGDITLSFTLLGRAQIIAISKDDTREIVLNPRTGEILRDFAQSIETDGVQSVAIAVEPIVLAPEAEGLAEMPTDTVPADLVPAEVPLDPALDVAPVVLDGLVDGYVDTTPLDTVTSGAPDLSTPDASVAGTDPSATGGVSESTAPTDPGTAP